MNWDTLRRRLEQTVEACERRRAKHTHLHIQPPAPEEEVVEVERQIGGRLPVTLREVLLGHSRGVQMYWFLDEAARPPRPELTSGLCEWSLDTLEPLDRNRRKWIEACFPDPGHSAGAAWRRAVCFAAVGDGDMLALDRQAAGEPVVFLSHDAGSHDGSTIHGWQLGDTFIDYLDRHSRLGFVGPSEWQLEPFLTDPLSGLRHDVGSAVEWRSWLGLDG